MHLDIYTYDWFFFHKRDINTVGGTVKRERKPSWGWSRHNGWGGDNPQNKQRNNNNNNKKIKKSGFFFFFVVGGQRGTVARKKVPTSSVNRWRRPGLVEIQRWISQPPPQPS